LGPAAPGLPRSALYEYDWPGNIRELENVIERSLALAKREMITLRATRNHFEGQYVLAIGLALGAVNPVQIPSQLHRFLCKASF
jgi:transcriptional regulator with PAS, ATPase and Fis domain